MVNEARCLFETIRQMKKSWIRHMLKGNGLLRNELKEECQGRSSKQAKTKNLMLDDLWCFELRIKVKENESFL